MAQGQRAAHGQPAERSPRAVVSGEAAHAANVLLLGPSLERRGDVACRGLLDTATDPDGVLLVSLVGSPAARLAAWREHAIIDTPDRVAIVAPGVDEDGTLPVPGSGAVAEVERFGNPPDLVRIWMAVSDRLDRWDGRTAVCLDSLTALLGVTDPRRVLRFCKTLAERIRADGDAAHYHLDPDAVDDPVIDTFAALFDCVAGPAAADGS